MSPSRHGRSLPFYGPLQIAVSTQTGATCRFESRLSIGMRIHYFGVASRPTEVTPGRCLVSRISRQPRGQAMKASDVFIKCLEQEGVEYVFGVPGEENLDFLDSLSRSSIKLILTRHEQGA